MVIIREPNLLYKEIRRIFSSAHRALDKVIFALTEKRGLLEQAQNYACSALY